MSKWRATLIVALALVSALIAVASPAFATPNLTASSGTRAVSPFITPIGNTRSLSIGSSTDSQFALPSLGVTVSCTTSTVAGYVDAATRTQIRVTSISFGDRGGRCRVSPSGTVDNRPDITCTATSANPWFLHTRNLPSATSAGGTINPTSSCVVRVTVIGISATVTLDARQSCRANAGAGNNEYTWNRVTRVNSLVVNCALTTTVSNPRSSPSSTLRGTYTVRPVTSGDAQMTVTAQDGPFVTPIGDVSRSRVTGSDIAADFNFEDPRDAERLIYIECGSELSGYVPTNHTRVFITDLRFSRCTTDPFYSNIVTVTTDATPSRPYILYFDGDAGGGVFDGTFVIPLGQRIDIETTDPDCFIHLDPQALPFSFTRATNVLSLQNQTLVFTLGAGWIRIVLLRPWTPIFRTS